jgi:putative ABC transport system permease protein
LFHLALSNFSVHRIRVALTVAAVALSVSLVVAVTSGYTSAEAAAYKYLAQFIGTTDAQITRQSDVHGNIPESLVDQVRQDPDVARADGRLEMESGLLDKNGKPLVGPPAQVIGIRRPDDRRVETMQMHAGTWFDRPNTNEAVIDQAAQEKLGVALGDNIVLPSTDGRLTLKVVGVTHKPGILAQAIQTIYVPIETLQNFALPENPRQITRVMIDLKDGADDRAFEARWKPKLATIDPTLKFKLASDNRREMDKNLQGLHVLSYLGGMVSMVAATFIVFSALSMGVAERQRMLGMLRAIGAYRGQLGWLVITEGLILAGLGVAIGIPLGILWIRALVWKFGDLFMAGMVISWGGVIFAAVASALAALGAS